MAKLVKMKQYIMIFGFADYISGGPIYNRNKLIFLKEQGWKVTVLPANKGKVYIHGLESYSGYSFDFLTTERPYLLPPKKVEDYLRKLECCVDTQADFSVIETGTDSTAYWGELLANRLGCKHMIYFLDENNQNLNAYNSKFFEFKYRRGELACISEQAMVKQFGKFFHLNHLFCFNAWCSNSIQNYYSEIINQIPVGDYNIGYIGRLEKTCVKYIIDSVISFANEHETTDVSLIMFGGSNKNTVNKIKKQIKQITNIKLYISGYIWPIPLDAAKKCDVFIAVSGSAGVAAQTGVPTIKLDMYSSLPLGFVIDPNTQKTVKCRGTLKECLNQALIVKEVPLPELYDFGGEWRKFCTDFENQLSYVINLGNKAEWYNVKSIKAFGRKERLEKLFFKFFTYKQLHAIKHFIFNTTFPMRWSYTNRLR